MNDLVQGDVSRKLMFLMVAAADHIAGLAGLTPVITLSENGGAFGSATNAAADLGSGWYSLTLAAGEVDTLGALCLHATGTDADPVDVQYQVKAFDHNVALASQTVGTVTNAVTTDTASRTASKADVSDLADIKTIVQAATH